MTHVVSSWDVHTWINGAHAHTRGANTPAHTQTVHGEQAFRGQTFQSALYSATAHNLLTRNLVFHSYKKETGN